MKTVYAIIHKIDSPEEHRSFNSFSSVSKDEAIEHYENEIKANIPEAEPVFKNEALAVYETEDTEFWISPSVFVIKKNATNYTHTVSIIEAPFKKKEIYFNIELEDNTVINQEGHIETLKDAKAYVQKLVDSDKDFFKNVAPPKIVKYVKYYLKDDGNFIWNVLMENPFTVKNHTIKYSKQIKHQ